MELNNRTYRSGTQKRKNGMVYQRFITGSVAAMILSLFFLTDYRTAQLVIVPVSILIFAITILLFTRGNKRNTYAALGSIVLLIFVALVTLFEFDYFIGKQF